MSETIPQHESLALNARAAFENLNTAEADINFAQRLQSETKAFNLEDELASISKNEEAVEGQIKQEQAKLANDLSADTTNLRELSANFDDLDIKRRAARRLDMFQKERQRVWERDHTKLYDSREDEVSELTGALQLNVPTEEQPFMRDDTFLSKCDFSKTIIIDAGDQPLQFPLSAFVSAAGFDSWEEGRGRHLKDDRRSREVIADYASRPTDLPRVDSAVAMITAEGEVLLLSENSHRVAAAKLKGQQSIEVASVRIVEAKINSNATEQ